jgi:hypothetical protein
MGATKLTTVHKFISFLTLIFFLYSQPEVYFSGSFPDNRSGSSTASGCNKAANLSSL